MADPALLEREVEMAGIAGAIDDAVADPAGGSTVVVEGPAGIGKSAVLDAAAAIAAERGMRILRARAGEFEREFAFGVVRGLLERELMGESEKSRSTLLAGAASHARPALGLGGDAGEGERIGQDLPFTVVHGVYWLIANLADRAPLLIAVDDLHWCDEPSLRALHYLASRVAEHPIVLLVGSRLDESEAPEMVASTLALGSVHLRPAALGEDAVARMFERAYGEPVAKELIVACLESSSGNPFLISELIGSLREEGAGPGPAAAPTVSKLVPASVVRATLLRIGRLPAPAAGVAAALSVLGENAPVRHVAALAGASSEDAALALDSLHRAGIAWSGEGLASFCHPLVREAVYSELPPGSQAAHHARAAELSLADGARAVDVVHHLLDSPRTGDPLRVAQLRSAGGALLVRGAPEAARHCFQRALDEPAEAQLVHDLGHEIGRSAWLAGNDPGAAVEHLRSGLAGAEPGEERAARTVALARAVIATGDVVGAFDVLDQGLPQAELEGASGRLLAEHGAIGLLHADTREAAIARISSVPAAEDDPIAVRMQEAVRGMAESLDGSAAKAAESAESALGGGELLHAEGPDSLVFYDAIYVLIVTDRHRSAAAHLAEGKELARRTGSSFGFASVCALESVLAWRRGEIASALAEARSALDTGVGHAYTLPLLLTCSALAMCDQGKLDQADQLLAPLSIGPELPELVQVNPAFFARAVLRALQGRNEEASADLAELDRRDRRLGALNPSVPWRAIAVRLATTAGDAERARGLADSELEFAQRWGTVTARGQAARARGLALVEGGLDDLREAVEVLADSPSRRERLLATIDLGEALRRAGERREAQAALKDALDLAQRCGATGLAERAHAELKVAGAKPRRLQFSGLDSLTPGERRVSELAAEGLANKEIAEALFLSARTVENHLARVYRKLGIGSRSQLPEALGLAI